MKNTLKDITSFYIKDKYHREFSNEDICEMEEKLVNLGDETDMICFNQALLSYMELFPERLVNPQESLANTKKDIPRIYEKELNDFLAIKNIKDPKDTDFKLKKSKKIFSFNNMPILKNVYSVESFQNERFKAYIKEHDCKIETLSHCSDNQNWYRICSEGLKIRPSGITIHGKCLGEGLYFDKELRTSFLSNTGSFTEDDYIDSRFFGIFNVAITKSNSSICGTEYCIFDEDAVCLNYLVEVEE